MNQRTEGSLSEEEEREVERVRGLAHCDLMNDWLAANHARRLKTEKQLYRSSASLHLMEHGHELRFGCCSATTR